VKIIRIVKILCIPLILTYLSCASQPNSEPDPKLLELILSLSDDEAPVRYRPSRKERKQKRLNTRLKHYNDLLAYPIYFRKNQSVLTMESLDNISKKVRLLEKTDYNIVVNGYAFVKDGIGISKENSYLVSKSRAIVVRDALVKKGIVSDRISTIGHGNIAAYTYQKYVNRNERVVITLTPKDINLSTGDF